MSEVYHIYLFRHGQTTYNRDGKFTGFSNPPLTKLGIKQAKIIARKLRNKKFEVAIQTRLIRSKNTLKEVLKFHPECCTIIEDNRMIERNYGKLNGTSHNEFIKKMGKKLYQLEIEGDLINDLDKEGKKEIQKFLGETEYALIHRGYNIPPPGGESFADVEKRVSTFIKDLTKFIKRNKVNVAISAHGNSIRLFRKVMENAKPQESTKWVIPYDNYYEYKIKA